MPSKRISRRAVRRWRTPKFVSGPTLLTGLIHCGKCGGAMMIAMESLDDLFAGRHEKHLLYPDRLEDVLAAVLDRRQERSDRRREHIAGLNKRAAETEPRPKRLYDAIESRVAALDDPALKDWIDELKATRDQAQADAARASALLQGFRRQAVTPAMLRAFARKARQRIRVEEGEYRRDHLRALAQRVEVDKREVRIMGSRSNRCAF